MPPVNALAAIKFTKIQCDSPGSDTGTKSSLNPEWVKIKTMGKKDVSCKSWTEEHCESCLPVRLIQGQGRQDRHSSQGKRSDSRKHVYQDSGAYIWNKDGDTAKLKWGNKI